jgi:hypothetical protein
MAGPGPGTASFRFTLESSNLPSSRERDIDAISEHPSTTDVAEEEEEQNVVLSAHSVSESLRSNSCQELKTQLKEYVQHLSILLSTPILDGKYRNEVYQLSAS